MQTNTLQPRIGIATAKVFGIVLLFFSIVKYIASLNEAEQAERFLLLFLRARLIEAFVASVIFFLVFYLLSRRCNMIVILNDQELIAPVKKGTQFVSKKIPLTDIRTDKNFFSSFGEKCFSTLEGEKIFINHICYPSSSRRKFKSLLQQKLSERRIL